MLIRILITLFVLSDADDDQCSLRFMKLKCDIKRSRTIESCNNQSNSTVCKKEFTISLISYTPLDFGLYDLFMEYVLLPCCDDCIRYKIINNFPSLANFLNSTNKMNATKADFVMPVMAPKSTTNIYGYNYYPLTNAPSGVYIVSKPKATKIYTLLKAYVEMWPLLIVSIVMAFIAGFFMWILDTWPNSEQFPRPFISGVLEGFWWSFVSMTTIGYGDKTPLGWPARLFAMMWILVGIIICSLLTASITSALTAPVQSLVMSDKKVGVLENRVYDQLFVLKKKGKPIEFKDITELMKHLQDESIDGAFLDRFAYAIFINDPKFVYEATFFSYDGDGLTFGLLISDSSVSTFIGNYIYDHAMAFDLCAEEVFQKLVEEDVAPQTLFDPKIKLFYYVLWGCGVIFFIIVVFGFFYERKRRKTEIKVKDEKTAGKESQRNEKKQQQQEPENVSRIFFVQDM